MEQLKHLVGNVRQPNFDFAEALRRISEQKQSFLEQGDEESANLCWAYEQVVEATLSYLRIFDLLQASRFYDAW